MLKKMIKVLGLSLLALTIFTACSDDDSTSPTTYENIFVHWMNDSTNVSFKDMTTIDVDGLDAIQLSSFITDDLVPQDPDSTYYSIVDDQYEARNLYSYQVVGDDGFCASLKGYKNNSWKEIGLGFIMFDSRDVIFPDGQIDLAGAYNIKETRHINILRKFDVICNDTISTFYDLEKMPTVMVDNHDGIQEEAISLSSFIEQAIADSVNINVLNNSMLTTSDFNIRSVDNWGPSTALTWTQLQTGYWLKESKKTIFTDGTLAGGAYKVKFLEKITIDE